MSTQEEFLTIPSDDVVPIASPDGAIVIVPQGDFSVVIPPISRHPSHDELVQASNDVVSAPIDRTLSQESRETPVITIPDIDRRTSAQCETDENAFGTVPTEQDTPTASPAMFERIRKLGQGDVGRVYLVRDRENGEIFAMKVLTREEMVQRRKIQRCLTECEILATVDHPLIVQMHYSFKTEKFLYFVIDYCAGGEFFRMLRAQPNRRISEEWTRFYSAEVVLALEYLHSLGFVYRDLKPENILLHGSGHIKLTDFDLAVRIESGPASIAKKSFGWKLTHLFSHKERKEEIDFISPEPLGIRHSFVGTPEYCPPEMLRGEGHSASVDWWTLGILIYEMHYGRTPFVEKNEDSMFAKIADKGTKPGFPDGILISPPLKILIKSLLKKKPEKRLGAKKGASEIKDSEFFANFKFQLVRNSTPPYVPQLRHALDDRAFIHLNSRDKDDILDVECPWASEESFIRQQSAPVTVSMSTEDAIASAFKQMGIQNPAAGGTAPTARPKFLSYNGAAAEAVPTSPTQRPKSRPRFRSEINKTNSPADLFAAFGDAIEYRHRNTPPHTPKPPSDRPRLS